MSAVKRLELILKLNGGERLTFGSITGNDHGIDGTGNRVKARDRQDRLVLSTLVDFKSKILRIDFHIVGIFLEWEAREKLIRQYFP